jgi:hypothetical protein
MTTVQQVVTTNGIYIGSQSFTGVPFVGPPTYEVRANIGEVVSIYELFFDVEHEILCLSSGVTCGDPIWTPFEGSTRAAVTLYGLSQGEQLTAIVYGFEYQQVVRVPFFNRYRAAALEPEPVMVLAQNPMEAVELREARLVERIAVEAKPWSVVALAVAEVLDCKVEEIR